ncbi:hypothetical protein M422DRAFT_266372 [Sphaerobolus stellatus SS14]|uniref:Uncharacterized protein n=1 Tax=Sphaerobolus stellatus (strain SS14) TaxID=990650 RepID=A0A0C9URQ6_SPHS4|nr:hypothetical protein M422DRAFT_266372 [Sphaerobolus stellatus SS14]
MKTPSVIAILEDWNIMFYSELPEFPKQINYSTVEEGLDDIINDLCVEAEQVVSDSDREDHGTDQENSKGVESLQIGDSERDDHGTNIENSKEVEKLEMVTVVTYCTTLISVIKNTHQYQQFGRSPSPLTDIGDETTLHSHGPHQSSPLPDTRPHKKSNGRWKITAVMDSQDEEGQENIPPKKIHKKQCGRARKEAIQSSLRRSMRLLIVDI